MVNCSKTKEFLQEWARLCKNNVCGERCSDVTCPIEKVCDGRYSWCYLFIKNYPDDAIEIVQKWSDEHPQETKSDEFLKLHPNAFRVDDNNGNTFVNICPKYIDMAFNCIENHDVDFCYNCKRDYWLSEVK